MRGRVSALLLVALGGAAGSAARAGVALAMPGSPLAATLLVNVVGAFALALLVGVLDGAGPGPGDAGEEARRQRRRQRRRQHRARLLLGTGFCGGFTTYSAVALQSAELIGDSALAVAAAYMLGTLLLGTLATAAGLVLGGRSMGARR